MKKLFLYLLIIVLVASCKSNEHKTHVFTNENTYLPEEIAQPDGQVVKNVILMIGDGMGLPQISCGWTVNHGHLYLDNFSYTGLSRTYCKDRLITDSGAGGTALACGEKTYYHHIATDSLGNEMPSLIDFAHELGMRSGISVICGLDDATPADFCCHDTSRYSTEALIADYIHTKADFVVGGGQRFFTNRKDGRNICKEMIQNGWNVAFSQEEFFAADSLPLIGVLADNDYPLPSERGDLFTRQTMKAIEMLDNENGFFLMVEGSLIDGWCHENHIGNAMAELMDFDKTIGEVLKWAAADGQTLVIVTADHETAGLTLLGGNLNENKIEVQFANEDHSNIQVPVFAFGPQAQLFTGTHENAEISSFVHNIINNK